MEKRRIPFKAGCLLVLSLTLNVILLYQFFVLRAAMRDAMTPEERERLQEELAAIEREWAERASATPEKREELYQRMRDQLARLRGADAPATESPQAPSP